jgi:pimeloyl-ACP methyl ester carboxylesterase
MTTPATWTTAITAGWSITTVDGPGPTLLWLHGLGEHAATFAPAIAHLPQHRHLLLDLPGHGGARAVLARGAAPWSRSHRRSPRPPRHLARAARRRSGRRW